MKRLFLVIIIALISFNVIAQKDVTKFLGIPVDGTKTDMIQKIKAKGFKPTTYDKDVLQGEFNGRDVYVHVVTNGDKVYRIMLSDVNSSNESDIKIRFNTLCRQFKKNDKYSSMNDYTIPEDENISVQMTIYNKRFQASFYQKPESIDTVYVQNQLLYQLRNLYTDEQIENPSDEIKNKIEELAIELSFEIFQKKSVWFMINETGYDEYNILMFYDNEYNNANGEDL